MTAEQVTKMRTLLAPFFLRRLKSEVCHHLPAKTEVITRCDLTAQQRDVYHQIGTLARGHHYSRCSL